MIESNVRLRAALSSLTDNATSAVRTYVDAVLNCIEKTARFLVSLEPCAPADRGPGAVCIDMPQHAHTGKLPTAEARLVEPGKLTVTTFPAHADWEDAASEERAMIDLDRAALPPGLFIGRVQCEPDKPGRPSPCSRFVIYQDGLP